LSAPIEITDPEIIGKFNIWNGPGVGMRDIEQTPDLPLYVEREGSVGRFIDWPKGVAAVRPSGLQRVEVTFYMGEHHSFMPYVVAYEIDPIHGIGYIYLPRWKNSHMIWHGAEGYWYHAHERWNELIMPKITNESAVPTSVVEMGDLPCTLGVGTLNADSTIEVFPLDRHGKYSTKWSFAEADEEYPSVRELFGNAAEGTEFELSCWPPRI
jgi:hypothetical protein